MVIEETEPQQKLDHIVLQDVFWSIGFAGSSLDINHVSHLNGIKSHGTSRSTKSPEKTHIQVVWIREVFKEE